MPDTSFTLPSIPAEDALKRADAGALILLDLRKPAAVAESGQRIAGAVARDPFGFAHEDALMQSDRPIAVFCVHGHEVSNFGCALLRVHGRDAVFVAGGFEALIGAGAQTVPA